MIKRKFEYYCNEIENVENYEKAKADNFVGWNCHHRLELVATGGVCDVTAQDLIDWNLYYNRPADELIFLTLEEHISLHHKGMKHSEETKRKMSEALKGRPLSEEHKKKVGKAHKGMKRSEEARRRMSEAQKGKKMSDEFRKKCSERMKGTHWKLVDGKHVYY